MKYLFVVFYLFFLIYPAEAVTTKMFKVLDTCARYRLGEINANEAIEKLKLKSTNSSTSEPKDLVKKGKKQQISTSSFFDSRYLANGFNSLEKKLI